MKWLAATLLITLAAQASVEWADLHIPVDKTRWRGVPVSEKLMKRPMLKLFHRRQQGLSAQVMKGHPEKLPPTVKSVCQQSPGAQWMGGRRHVCVLNTAKAHTIRFLEPVTRDVVTPVLVSFDFPKGVDATEEFNLFVEGLMK